MSDFMDLYSDIDAKKNRTTAKIYKFSDHI